MGGEWDPQSRHVEGSPIACFTYGDAAGYNVKLTSRLMTDLGRDASCHVSTLCHVTSLLAKNNVTNILPCQKLFVTLHSRNLLTRLFVTRLLVTTLLVI